MAIDDLNLTTSDDIVNEERPLAQLRLGNILDAQDYLGSWHLSIVISEGANAESSASGRKNSSESRTLHFLPFQKANRDEVFTVDD